MKLTDEQFIKKISYKGNYTPCFGINCKICNNYENRYNIMNTTKNFTNKDCFNYHIDRIKLKRIKEILS